MDGSPYVKESKINLNQQFKVIILPKTICLSQKEAQAFRHFVENGGTLVADYLCGIFDDHGKWRKTGILDDLFNIKRNDSAGYLNGKGVTEIDAEKYTKPFDKRFTYYNGAFDYQDITIFERGTKNKDVRSSEINIAPDFIIKNRFANGTAYYLNLTPLRYWMYKARFSEFGNWRAIIAKILTKAGLEPRVRVISEDKSAMMESLFYRNGKNIYLGIIENPSDNFDEIKGNPTKIELLFNRKVVLKNLRTEKEFKSKRKRKFKDIFLPWEGNLYQVKFE